MRLTTRQKAEARRRATSTASFALDPSGDFSTSTVVAGVAAAGALNVGLTLTMRLSLSTGFANAGFATPAWCRAAGLSATRFGGPELSAATAPIELGPGRIRPRRARLSGAL